MLWIERWRRTNRVSESRDHFSDALGSSEFSDARVKQRLTLTTWVKLAVALWAIFAVMFIAYLFAYPGEVSAFQVGTAQARWTISGPGLVDATNRVNLTARIQGRLINVAVQRNDRVTKGQVLAKLESEDLENQLLASQADADAAKRAITLARSGQAKSQAALDKVIGDLSRRKQLVESGSVSRADFEAIEAAHRQAQAELESASIAIQRAEAQARAADATVKSLMARAEDAKLISPLDGVVVSRERNVGDVVLPGATVLQLVDPQSIIVSARFDESVMGAARPGLRADIQFMSETDQTYDGEVLRVGRQVDQETREFTADISLRTLPPNWALGQRAKISIEVTALSRHVVVPQRLMGRSEGRAGVWVASGGRALWRNVTLGRGLGPYVEVTQGLRKGDIILDPTARYWFEPVQPKFQ